MRKTKEITIKMDLLEEGQYFCDGQRLDFDLPWSIYVVNGDLYAPYYRVYLADCFMGMSGSPAGCHKFLKNMTREGAHIAEM